jgi:acyl-CoA reductase-like NAD-dependent aldehyde dehydrogenase
LKAIKTAEAWVHGEGDIILEDIRKASAAAYAAYAADAAADAAYAAYAAAAAADAAAAAARKSILKQCADIVRKYYPDAPELT